MKTGTRRIKENKGDEKRMIIKATLLRLEGANARGGPNGRACIFAAFCQLAATHYVAAFIGVEITVTSGTLAGSDIGDDKMQIAKL